MVAKTPTLNPLFLREDEIRRGIELLFFAYRDFTADADAVLNRVGLGRAHHRVIYFVGQRPGITVSEVLAILGITKQSLSRVLGRLVQDGYIEQTPGRRDRRQRCLKLTEKGTALERQLTDVQIERIGKAYRAAGAQAVEGFATVLEALMEKETRARVTPRKEL